VEDINIFSRLAHPLTRNLFGDDKNLSHDWARLMELVLKLQEAPVLAVLQIVKVADN